MPRSTDDTGFTYTKVKRPDWPNAKPFTIVISESGPAEPAFDAATREFRITMHKDRWSRSRLPKAAGTKAIRGLGLLVFCGNARLYIGRKQRRL